MNKDFIILTGYYAGKFDIWQEWLHGLWWDHNFKGKVDEDRLYVVQCGGSPTPEVTHGHWVPLRGNLGHPDELTKGGAPYELSGNPCIWMIGAWLAYGSKCDLVHCEQDCLCFGPWLERLYEEMGDKKAIFSKAAAGFPTSSSLFIVRHEYIPTFVSDYAAEGKENHYNRLSEYKIGRMMARRPEDYAECSFNLDRNRPLTPERDVWAFQKPTRAEMESLMVPLGIESLPDVKLFSNHE